MSNKGRFFNISKHYLLSILVILSVGSLGWCQSSDSVDWPVTRAEKSDYQETSLYADVIEFLETLQIKGAPIAVEYIGESPEGKRIPLVIASRPMVAGPAEARRSGRPIVYLQANIHAGEVEGKEATLMLLRDFAREAVGEGMLDEIVLLTTPIYNIDGNEKISENNRRGQNGPLAVGVRSNGQGLDLNRDGIKAASNEMQAVLKHVYTKWDPDAIIDLHTTNGSRHGYQLTYAPAQYPNLDEGVEKFNRDKLLPTVRKRLQDEHDIQVFDYGNTSRGRGEMPQQVTWRTFGCEPRYVSNYAGARNRIGVLSETVTYVPFDNRVRVAYHFVRMVLDEIRINKEEVVRLMRQADNRVIDWGLHPERAPELGVAFTMDNRGIEDMLLEKPGTYDRSVIGPPKELETVKVEVRS
ncbi:MAG: M14 family metallopeptidase, partial [Planctomycetes bacterium]|nr:M14 family metallopeptidase [Planctomycetota bacterium]